MPYFTKKPNDWVIRHSRNSNIKDQLFYDLIRGSEIEQVCLRLDHEQEKKKSYKLKGQVKDFISEPDVWL